MKKTAVLSALTAVILLIGCHSAQEWGYHGEHGPANWGGVCASGKSQSPIDIVKPTRGPAAPITFTYKSTASKIVNTGEAIKIIYEAGNTITVSGKTFKLLQMHFHTPSEHTISGQPQPLELHLVHQGDDGQLAVVGIMIKQGAKNNEIENLWAAVPANVGEEKPIGNVDPASFLPANRSYYGYSGSLTTPPCSEGVKWHVLKTMIELSADQVNTFKKYVEHNARPVQPLGDRVLSEF